jgi:hypothetical protein
MGWAKYILGDFFHKLIWSYFQKGSYLSEINVIKNFHLNLEQNFDHLRAEVPHWPAAAYGRDGRNTGVDSMKPFRQKITDKH